MAKKKNSLKFRERFKRKMQIEAAKNRDQVNIYGGLGKVGLDHQGLKALVDENGEEVAPAFSESAMKYLKKVKVNKEDED